MSGDNEPREYVAGALRALAEDGELRATLVGDRALIEAALAAAPAAVRARAAVAAASQIVTMEEKPREAIRHKKDSSMRIAIDLVREGAAAACVSAGNTGALTAIAHFVLKTLPGVERAAIISAIPAAHGHTHMLDLGANTKATPEQLRQFAAMGAIIARDVYGVAAPRIGLLNIGEEDMKGHEVVQSAHALLGASGLNYVGFVEGDDIFSGDVDVVVTDGFTGNVALKTAEGTARFVRQVMRDAFTSSWQAKLGAVIAGPALKRIRERLDPSSVNGGPLLGLNGLVIKSHGGADAKGFANAIKVAYDLAASGYAAQIDRNMKHLAAALPGSGPSEGPASEPVETTQ
ncbi:MAG: phosphate acyltransferase PlsX [Gammaproteobacteria bacterium]|nr:phosphate acyltransferase PlsX [Gammaproteobacteria bacterium]